MEKKKHAGKCTKAVSVILVLAWMVLIFRFSAQPANLSSEISGGISFRIINGVNTICNLWENPEEIGKIAECIDYPLRKAAHMSEYAVLALLIYRMLCSFSRKELTTVRKRYCCLYAFLLTVVYASTDEFHQLFVPGRAGRVTDVLIDSAGAVIALLFVILIIKLKQKRKR